MVLQQSRNSLESLRKMSINVEFIVLIALVRFVISTEWLMKI